MHECDGMQAGYVLDLAKHFQSGQLSDEKIATMDDDTLVAQLTKVKGIGKGAYTMPYALSRVHLVNACLQQCID